ncbi:pali-domain-containing protein [Pluteus cervinus]|uniref:Pali-domain-containing protein n=1 Tax=Pluteus cervinus TaxID=181527 RepID=A0ACD3BAQ5_9AGAR|nr:pali-domain-containing protein [Pluteus cervinus]
MVATPPLPGVFLCFAAFVLLLFASLSGWSRISFLDVGSGSTVTHYGAFGPAGSSPHIGYRFLPAGANSNPNSDVIYNLTKTLILHPIACVLSFLAFIFGAFGVCCMHRFFVLFMAMLSGLAALITLLAFVLDMVMFGITRGVFRRAGVSANYGNANWLTLGALFALLFGFCASALGLFGRYRKRRDAY